MEINIQKLNPNRLIVKAEGKINMETVDEYKAAIKDNLDDIKELVLDFSSIVYISSIGLRILLEFHQEMTKRKGAMYIKNVNSEVKNVFDISGFDNFLNIV